jgi:hypothetical protein
MKTRIFARGDGLRIAALAACLVTAGAAHAAGSPSAESSQTARGALAGGPRTVRYGQRLELEGRLSEAAANRSVRLQYAPRGEGWRPAAEARTGAGGSYSFSVRPPHSGAYRALFDRGATPPRGVTVLARLAARSRHHLRLGSRLRVRGALAPRRRGRAVRLELGRRGRWRTVDRARTGRGGRFRLSWRPTGPGRFRLRVRFGGDRLNAVASRRLRGRVYVYRPSLASWYGPGLYGNHLACGGTLGQDRLGVAHRWLPCGTRVTFRYRGRSLTLPVIDRGPFAAGREWDLSAAAKRRLRFPSTGTVWSTR